MAEDLSADSLSQIDREVANLGLIESSHRRSAQDTAVSAAITVSVLMFMTAVFLAGCLVYLIAQNPQIHWHSSILIAALTIPPTVMMVTVIRAVFQNSQQEKDEKPEPTPWPVQEAGKELIKAMKEAVTKA